MASSSRTGTRQMARIRKINLITNHFVVNFTNVKSQDHFFQYSVAIKYEDNTLVKGKRLSRKILAKVQQVYKTELGSKNFAYDGDKTLYTVGSLPEQELDFSVVLEDMSCCSSKSEASTSDARPPPVQSKTFKVEIKFAARISIQVLKDTFQGDEPNDLQNAVRAMDVMLRQNAATRGHLLVRQSFFSNEVKYLLNHFGGVRPCRGFHSSFRPTQGGLSLNIDVSTTLLVNPGSVIDFLTANQEVNDQSSIDWRKAKLTLKNLRVKIYPSNRECTITGLSNLTCGKQKFTRKLKQANGVDKEVEVTVYKYFTETHQKEPSRSHDLPCIDVGTLKRPVYIPIELCELVPLQRYTKALTSSQRSKMVTASVQDPQKKIDMIYNSPDYYNDRMLQECGVSIGTDFTKVEGRILTPPELKAGDGRDLFFTNGRWNFNRTKFAVPATVTRWVVVNFSCRCNTQSIVDRLIKCGKDKGMNVDRPYKVVYENPRFKDEPANTRVEKMFEQMKSELGKEKPLFILCILAEKKNSLVYGPWKKKNLVEQGFVTQCIAPTPDINDQYLTNVLLKINAKLGGLNSLLAMRPSVTRVPTFIIGMDVSHGSPGSDVPSIAAVVGSREWPLISKYRACVRTQPRRTEMIENLFKPVTNNEQEVDEGIFWELLHDFQNSSNDKKPEHIIIFRDGVSESQFTQVLANELSQMKQACDFLKDKDQDVKWNPKFTVIISVKRHHTRFFYGKANVPPGTIVDSSICSPYINNFYLCAHYGTRGTSRPIHYHVLLNEMELSTDDLQELVHSLSYVYQRSTSVISQVAPVMYAHLAAAQMATAMKFEDNSETASSHGGSTRSGEAPVPPMPKLHPDVASSMFFC